MDPLGEDELEQLRARVRELEEQVEELLAVNDVREVEMRSLELDVSLKAQYIERLERIEAEVVGPKDVHIRNLEAIIADLQSEIAKSSSSDEPNSGPTPPRPGFLRKRKN